MMFLSNTVTVFSSMAGLDVPCSNTSGEHLDQEKNALVINPIDITVA